LAHPANSLPNTNSHTDSKPRPLPFWLIT
jgi:hypothetical protein